MDFAGTFRRRYDWLNGAIASLLDLPDDRWRARPHGLNSIAWLLWHMRRAEDIGLNRLLFDRPQLFDDPEGRWPRRLNVPLRWHGGRMTSPEVDALSAEIDLPALRAYAGAVVERAAALVRAADPEVLDRVVDDAVLLRLFDEGALRPDSGWVRERPPYAGFSRAELLLHFSLMHNYGHYHDISIVRGLLTTR
jgi:hypothetical protein